MTKAAVVVAVVSGGLDSAVLAHHLRAEGRVVRLLSFDYGQRHAKELDGARALATALHTSVDVVDLRSVGALLGGSALTDDAVAVPDGHYTDDSMRATVVPNRNAIFASVAVGVAVARKAWAVALGVHAGDHPVYPDCRPEFVEAVERLARVANEGFVDPDFRVLAPFLNLSKADIVRQGAELGVDFARTWSCYKGGELHCGTCGTCVERREAFALAGVADPTAYAAAVGAG
ncbi:MAG: 7-cyano-7-deazaguanine synthase QueC [Actinomycetota bacterium]|nr:7-cyano-7-deazaguanine synthase QueC [Acidimicrobiia bacterium]MDQ3293490.1 7-cyano-7-deazaguanine synthase QueC [Actinomycetota bacterium]